MSNRLSDQVFTKQLADLPPGEWFDRKGSLVLWVVTDAHEEREGYTLCVQPTTGHAEQLSNGERIYPRQRPY